MSENQPIQKKLLAFRKLTKFSNSAWNERGLNPSNGEMCVILESLLNECADDLITATKSDFKLAKLKMILKNGLSRFNASDYDTEERRPIQDLNK